MQGGDTICNLMQTPHPIDRPCNPSPYRIPAFALENSASHRFRCNLFHAPAHPSAIGVHSARFPAKDTRSLVLFHKAHSHPSASGNTPSAIRRTADEDGASPAKVARPFLTPRIEEPHPLAGLGIDARQVGTFMVVVGQACQSQVRGNHAATMLLGNDVVYLEVG
jgi:hypothetical protein